MREEARQTFAIKRKIVILEYARLLGSVTEACRESQVPRSSFYKWKRAFDVEGKAGLARKRPVARHHPRQIRPEVVEKIVHLRRTYYLGPQRIAWYLERDHGIEVSRSSVYRTLVCNDMRRLPRKMGRRAIHTRRYAKQVPDHHIQVDVKFLSIKAADGIRVRRFQYTAIDDAARIKALRIYRRHNQTNAVEFIDYVI